MWTIVNFANLTDSIPPDDEENGTDSSGGIQANMSLSDPNSTWDFHVDDPNQTISLKSAMPVIVFDENAPAIGGVPTVPSMNLCINSTLNNVHTSPGWATSGSLSNTLWDFSTNFFPKITVSNAALGYQELQQFTIDHVLGNVVQGTQYMFSIYQQGSGTISNLQMFIKLTFVDGNGSFLGSAYSTVVTPTTTQARTSVVGTAPAGTQGAFLEFGVQTTVANNNSGTVTFGTPQFEPMWFTEYGISYPTPDCNYNQVNSVLLPDGTVSRKCRRFAGYIENRVVSYAGKQRHYEVKCASSSKLLETIGLFSASYTSTQDTTIISGILSSIPASNNYNSPIGQISTGQQNEFAPSSTLINGVVIDSISWNNATLRQILNDLGSQSGSLYFVDAYYYLWYVPPSFAAGTINLSDTPDNITSFPYANFSIEYDFTNPVNVALVVGSKQKAATYTQNFTGTGSQTVFPLDFPPENVHTLTVAGSNVRAGVDGVDNSNFGTSPKRYQALINKQVPNIKFATAPANAAAGVISYTYEDQVISQVIAADSAGSANLYFWGLVNDSAITSTPAAKNRGLAELASYAYDRIILTFDLTGIYVPVGTLILFTNQSEGLTGAPFVVQTVQSDLQGGGVDNWQYTAGVYNPTIIDHLRNATKAIQKSPTTANVVVIASIDVALFDSLHINDSVSATTSNYASAVGADSPIAYYRLGESAGTIAYDISGNGHNGTINGTVTLNQTGALTGSGDTNKAMLFDGSTGWISSTASIASGSGTWSIEAWVKKSGTPSVLSVIASFGTWGTANETAFLAIDTSGFAQIGTFSGNHSSSVSVVDGAWHYLLGTYDGTNMKLYIDGNTTPAVNVAQTMALTGTGVAVASAPSSIHDPLAGTVDEVAFYNTNLSTARMTAHYNAGI